MTKLIKNNPMNPARPLVVLVSLSLIFGKYLSAQQSEKAVVFCNNITIKNNETEINIKELEIRGEGSDLKNPVLVKKKTGIPFSGRVFELYRNGQRRALGSLKNGKHQDSWLYWYDDGNKKCEATFNNGNRNGLWVYWHKNSQKKYVGNYKDGKMDGLWVYWHENGQKEWEGNYKEGKLEGLSVRWHESGEKMEERNYKNGEMIEGSEKFWNHIGQSVDSYEEANE